MKNSTYSPCYGVPWQASSACIFFNFRDELLAAIQEPGIIHEKTSGKLTEEAAYMIYVILAFFGLAVFRSSITMYEFFFKANEKKSLTNSHDEYIAKRTNRKEKKLSKRHEDSKSFLKCFCMVSNGKKILSISNPKGHISCLQGLRFLSNASIIGFHTVIMFVGILRKVEELKPLFDFRVAFLVLNSNFAVDAFFVISGFLNAHGFFQEYSRSNGNISWFYFYLKRYVRLTPVYIIVLGFNTVLFAYTGTGNLWPTYNTNPVCQKDWWWHLLYVNNFKESTEQCLLWCWSLAADMQFYIVSPIFMVPLIRWPLLGYALIFACISGSCVISFALTYQYNITPGILRFATEMDDLKNFSIQFFEYVNVVYVKPYTRISSYTVAILLAYYLHMKTSNKEVTRNSAITLSCGWIATIISMWICFLSLHKREEILMVTALYNSTKHLLFSCGLSWMIYLCLTGQSKFLNECLSWKFFLPFSRLSYCAFLIHPLVIARLSFQYTDFIDFSYISMIWLYIHVCGYTYVASFFTSILFEMPVLNLLDRFSKTKMRKKSIANHLD